MEENIINGGFDPMEGIGIGIEDAHGSGSNSSLKSVGTTLGIAAGVAVVSTVIMTLGGIAIKDIHDYGSISNAMYVRRLRKEELTAMRKASKEPKKEKKDTSNETTTTKEGE